MQANPFCQNQFITLTVEKVAKNAGYFLKIFERLHKENNHFFARKIVKSRHPDSEPTSIEENYFFRIKMFAFVRKKIVK
jgi:hypothetical protein